LAAGTWMSSRWASSLLLTCRL